LYRLRRLGLSVLTSASTHDDDVYITANATKTLVCIRGAQNLLISMVMLTSGASNSKFAISHATVVTGFCMAKCKQCEDHD